MSAWFTGILPLLIASAPVFIGIIISLISHCGFSQRLAALSNTHSNLSTRFHIGVQTIKIPERCVYCHDRTWEFSCRCGATYHRECWNQLQRCASLGCVRTKEQTDAEIQKRAYFLGTNQHNPDSFKNWLEAERLILS